VRERQLTILVVCLALLGCDPSKSFVPSGTGPSSAPRESLTAGQGLVLDASGKPVPGARVRVFESLAVPAGVPAGLLDSRTNPLLSDRGGGLVTTSSAGWSTRPGPRQMLNGSRRPQSLAEAVTDGAGRFSLSIAEGRYNLEASAPDGQTKAWQANLAVKSGGTFQTGPLTLLPTGRISGQVVVEDPKVKNLLQTQVFIPGSSYAASTTEGGLFEIRDVPVGTFPLYAWHPTLGDAYVDSAVRVESAQTSAAPRLVLRRRPPVVDAIVASDTDRETEVVAPGTRLDLRGRDFGASRGRNFKVAIEGVPIVDAERLSDEIIRFTVPATARNGNLTVEVDGLFAAAKPLRIVKSVNWMKPALSLPLGEKVELESYLEIRDTGNEAVIPAKEGERFIGLPSGLSFVREDTRTTGGSNGVLEATSVGEAAVTVKVGSLPPRALTVRVFHPGNLAPGDAGPIGAHHDHVVTRDGVSSTFVWIPVFQAYQLIRPEACGYAGQPAGSWVEDQPSSGVREVDWAVETFGGFYAGKYEACRADAVPGTAIDGAGATQGSALELKVARSCMPWPVTFDQALEACSDYDPACHLMADDEWTALAVWSMIRGVTVYGNNLAGEDFDDSTIKFPDPPINHPATLTGRGYSSSWRGSTNLTTHTGTTAGVYDLNGNMLEWTSTLGKASRSNRYTVNGVELDVSVPESGYIPALSTDPRLRRYGVPETTVKDLPLYRAEHFLVFGRDYFRSDLDEPPDSLEPRLAVRGGWWGQTDYCGVWYLGLYAVREADGGDIGFRPVLRY